MKINHTDKDYYSDLGIARESARSLTFGRYSMADRWEENFIVEMRGELWVCPMEAVGIVQPRWAKQT